MKKIKVTLSIILLWCAVGCGLTMQERFKLIDTGLLIGGTALDFLTEYDKQGGDSEAFRIAVLNLAIAEAQKGEISKLPTGAVTRSIEKPVDYQKAYQEVLKEYYKVVEGNQ